MATKEAVVRLLGAVSSSCSCPAHSKAFTSAGGLSSFGQRLCSKHAQTQAQSDYAFEMASSLVRYGAGVTREVGMDLENLGTKNVCVVTDKQLARLPPVQTTLKALDQSKINYTVFDKVRVEPSDVSFKEMIDFARRHQFDAFLAVGGGSVMDTAKVGNLYMCYPEAEFLDFVNAPLGKSLPVLKTLKPLIAVPTTAGTGSETTGVAIFDHKPTKTKTGIANRALRPTLGLVDPEHAMLMPARVTAYSGFDVLCHALESYTAIPFNERKPRPSNPKHRPAYQGSNPISDIWSKQALRMIRQYFRRAVKDSTDFEARSQMHMASLMAGIGFGNAGVHLCHGMSYPISGLNQSYKAEEYPQDHPIVPHGLSVVITAPAVFQFTSIACPERHLEAAELLGADITNAKAADGGRILADVLREYMHDLDVPDGISAFGFSRDDIPKLVKGTLPQERVLKISPLSPVEEDLHRMLEASLKVY